MIREEFDCPHCGKTFEISGELRVKLVDDLQHDLDQDPADFLSLSARPANCFKYAAEPEIRTMRQLVTLCERDLLRIPGFGVISLLEVKEQLDRAGLRLGMDLEKK